MSEPKLLIALAGNPNTGKTTLFNALTGTRARVGNYPGVTVERSVGEITLAAGGGASLVDIPGTYSLVSRSAEEQVAVDALLGLGGNPRPDAVIFCVDATQLHRNLYLVLQAQEMGVPMVVALTMVDELKGEPNIAALEQQLGVPVVSVHAASGEGLEELVERAVKVGEGPRPEALWRWEPSPSVAHAIGVVRAELGAEVIASDAYALWCLMSVEPSEAEGELVGLPDGVVEAIMALGLDGKALDEEVVSARYAWLDGHVASLHEETTEKSLGDRVDRVLVHPLVGFAIFVGIMLVLFQALFSWSGPAIDLVESGFSALGGLAERSLPESFLRDLLVEGVIGGCGAVVVFLPQILLLFFFIGLMEDLGYMARVAYLMDRVMRLMKLHGRAFVPMLSSFACAIPAVMATRTMERRRDRILTMMVVPLMTCSARLPVYTLIIAALFTEHQALVMIGMYLFSVVIALLAAWVLSATVLKAPHVPFLVELPPYRVPRLGTVVRAMWMRSKLFLTEAGTVIMGATIALWLLLSFPGNPSISADYEARIAEAGANVELVEQLEAERDGALLRGSYAGQIGTALEPAIAPLGYDWKIGVGLLGAFSAREVFVSTMGMVYNVGGDVDEESSTLRDRIKSERRPDGTPVFSKLTGLSLLVFFALASQCIGTLAAVKKETGGWRWPAFLFGYTFALAWLAAFAVYQGGRVLLGA